MSNPTQPARISDRGVPQARPAPFDFLSLAICGCILTYVWRMQDLFPIVTALKLTTLVSLAAAGFYFMDSDARRRLRSVRHPITTAATVIMVFAVLSVPTSLWPGQSFRFIWDDLAKNFVLFMILVASIRSFVDVRRYAGVLFVGAFIYAYYVFTRATLGTGGRLGDLFYYDANDVGMMLVASLPIGLFFVLRGKSPIRRLLAAGALMVCVVVIIRTGSRGSFLAIIAVGAYLLVFFSSLGKGWRLTIVACAGAAFLLVASDQYWEMMNTLLHLNEDYNAAGNSESGRGAIWIRGIGYMISHPVTGVGIRAFPIAEGTLSVLAERQGRGIGLLWSAAHNSFVQIGAELGIAGLLSFVAVLVHSFKSARKVGRGSDREGHERPTDEMVFGQALAGSVVGYGVAAFFLSQAYAAYGYILFGLVVGLHKVTPDDRVPRKLAQRAQSKVGRPRAHIPS